jgi:hypothetical protein
MREATAWLLLGCVPPATAAAQTGQPASPAPSLLVRVETVEPLSSLGSKRGDTFALRLLEAVALPDGSILPAGTGGRGEVVHAERAHAGGKPGELILAARFLETPQGRFRLRALRLTGVGKDQAYPALGMAIAAEAALPGASLLAFFIRGGQFVAPAGTQGIAKLDATPLPAPVPPPADIGLHPNEETPL